MKNILELQVYIRYQLSQLSSKNKHHEFEHLSRHFSRLRICSNILPATGPVGSGGDQGRDFETYRTYLNSTPIATSTFLGPRSEKFIVFACSLQKDIEPKIKSDIKTICGSNQKIDEVCYFSEANIPVGHRHKLQQWAKDEHQTELQIFDGDALAEQLTDLDLFWIAESYLDVSRTLYPVIDRQNSNYSKYRQKWLDKDYQPNAYSQADFYEIQHSIRCATFDKVAKPDLQAWIQKMETYLVEDDIPLQLIQKARYEIAVASLRGLNNLTERKKEVIDFFANMNSSEKISELEDATLLLLYCAGAYLREHFDIEKDLLVNWHNELSKILDNYISHTETAYGLSWLYQLKGQISLITLNIKQANLVEIEKEIFKYWELTLSEARNAPLYPLERFADLLTENAKFCIDEVRFLEISNTLDKLLEERTGGYITAEKCRDRAMVFYESEKYLSAIRQLHHAKINWFSAETLKGSILSMVTLAECYQELGLIYAAKYYSAAAAFLALTNEDKDVKYIAPTAISKLAACCYQGGEWFRHIQIGAHAFGMDHLYLNESRQEDRDHIFQSLVYNTVVSKMLLDKFASSEIASEFKKLYSSWPIDSTTIDYINNPDIDKNHFFHTGTLDENWDCLQVEFTGRPCSDLGNIREITWKALDIEWIVNFKNDFELAAIAEELISILQILLAEIAQQDLLLLPTTVVIDIAFSEGENFEFIGNPNNDFSSWSIRLPAEFNSNSDYQKVHLKFLTIAMTLIGQLTLLNDEIFFSKVDGVVKDGLPNKTFSVQRYSSLYKYFLPEKDFYIPNLNKLEPLEKQKAFVTIGHEELSWINQLAPNYSSELAETLLKNRYQRVLNPIKKSLPKLLKNPQVKQELVKLKKEGYRDWHILQIIVSIAVNYKVQKLVIGGSPQEFPHIFQEIAFNEEKDSDPAISPEIYTHEAIENATKMSYPPMINTWGLVLRNRTPDFKALKTLLDKRYRNLEDDIDHPEIKAMLNL